MIESISVKSTFTSLSLALVFVERLSPLQLMELTYWRIFTRVRTSNQLLLFLVVPTTLEAIAEDQKLWS